MAAAVMAVVGGLAAGSAAAAVTTGAAAVAAPGRAALVPPGTRAMWLWNRAAPATVISWAVARGVTEIFAHVTPNFIAEGDLPRLTELMVRADSAGIRLSALGGDPRWVFDYPAAMAWQAAAMNTGLFYRSHVDVEPYALDEWSSDREGTARSYLMLLDLLQAGDGRPLEVDVPFWYGTIPVNGGNLADEVLRRVDAVTVMSYRDTATGPNSMVAVGTDMLARASAQFRPVRLAAETQRLPDCPHCTFYEEGGRYMTTTLRKVDTAVAGYRMFAGIAVHHYGSWVALRR